MITTYTGLSKDHRSDSATGLQHRHFAVIAGIIRDLPGYDDAGRRELAEQFANRLTDTNPRFNTRRFLAACEVTP